MLFTAALSHFTEDAAISEAEVGHGILLLVAAEMMSGTVCQSLL